MGGLRTGFAAWLRWLAAGCAVAGGSMAGAASLPGACASSPAAAIRAVRINDGEAVGRLPAGQGYRVESVRWDSLQQQSWVVIRSCGHEDWPAQTMLADFSTAPGGRMAEPQAVIGLAAVAPIVRTGDVVRLWKTESHAHIELMGTAEQSGGVGSRVRVRLTTPKDGDGLYGQTTQYLAGVVRGPADVELEP